MRRSRSPASSCCIAFGRDSSDWDVSAFKIELLLQSGTRCFGPEFRAATQRLSARVGYLHQSQTERVQVPLTEAVSSRMRALVANNAPGQVFLRLDDIRYDKSNGVYYEVYVNPPPSEKLDIHTPGYVGNLALFGLKPHPMAGHPPPTARDIYVQYDISQLVREALAGNPKELTVVLVPRGLFGANGEPLPVSQETQGTLGSTQIIGH